MDIGPRRLTNNADSVLVGDLRLTVVTGRINSDLVSVVTNGVEGLSHLVHRSVRSIVVDVDTIGNPVEDHVAIDGAVGHTVNRSVVVGHNSSQVDGTALTDGEAILRAQGDDRLLSNLDSGLVAPIRSTTEGVVLRDSHLIVVDTSGGEGLVTPATGVPSTIHS